MSLALMFLEHCACEVRDQGLGRKALREIHFVKYKVAPRQGDRNVRDRVLLRLPSRLAAGLWQPDN